MSWFWIVGIALNVGLTAAAIVWVIRQGKPRNDPPREDAASEGGPDGPKGPPAAP